MKNNRINALVVRVTIVIFFAALATSLSLLPSTLQTHHNPFYAFAQIQKNVALSLSNLITWSFLSRRYLISRHFS